MVTKSDSLICQSHIHHSRFILPLPPHSSIAHYIWWPGSRQLLFWKQAIITTTISVQGWHMALKLAIAFCSYASEHGIKKSYSFVDWVDVTYIALNIFFAVAKICPKNARACPIQDIVEGVAYTWAWTSSLRLLHARLWPISRIISTSHSRKALPSSDSKKTVSCFINSPTLHLNYIACGYLESQSFTYFLEKKWTE